MSALSASELHRYSRQTCRPQIGVEGQERLRAARVLLLGLGGLGSPAALYLAAAGVGTLGVAEHDTVALHNLQRQILYGESDVGSPKLDAGFAALRALNSSTRLEAHPEGLTPENALALFSRYDLILDGTDNFSARYLANDAAFLTRRPLVHGSVFQFTGQLTLFDSASGGPCLRCLFPEMPDPESVPTCEQAGVFGALCGVVGSLMAMEAMKFLTGAGEASRGRLLLLDLLAGGMRTVRVARDTACPLCGAAPRIHEIKAENYVFDGCAVPIGADGEPLEISPAEARARLADADAPLVLDVREPFERLGGFIPGSLNIPLAQLGARYPEIPAGAALFVVCQKGMRSLRAARLLREKGRAGVRSVRGGMDGWAAEELQITN
jgi:adenylyltransferase/sulfurtransferase